MPTRHVLAWDLGTSGAKVGIVAPSGVVLGTEFEPVGLSLSNGGAEQSPDEWWKALVLATRRLLAREMVPTQSIAAVGVTAQWSGTVMVDAQGRALGNAVIWMDTRGAPAVKRLTGGFPEVQGYALHRLWRWMRLTGGAPTHAGKDPIGHILWLREARPELYARTHKFLEPKDYLISRLTGRFTATFDSIAMHWVTDNRDPRHIDYDAGLLDLVGLEQKQLPELCGAPDIVGTLLPGCAEELGLDASVVVVGGAADVHSGAIGAGTTRDFATHLYVGTSSWISCHLSAKKTDVLHNMAALPAAIPGRYLLLNAQETAGACLTHVADNLLFADDELGTPAPPNVFELFDRVAARAPAGSGRLLFLPWLYGERTPVEDARLRGGFVNYSLEHRRSHVLRSVLEGVAYNARWLFGHVERFVAKSIPELRFIGGGANSNLWCQIFADVLGREIARVDAPRSSNLRGAGLIAFVGLGEFDFDEVAERVPVERRFEPKPELRALYDELFAEFLELHDKNRGILRRLNRDLTPALPTP
ncbi:MAG TPA: FGGY-family carbohydrate kinase [Polyangiaceae bacterium]|nr:FGGY-family carbohydrate kinase [Polyangiaceae bacterium]